jgi:hypothetical protein
MPCDARGGVAAWADWRMGAEHFEACLIDHTPDANWGNWAYRILPRPCLLRGLWQNWRQGDLGGASGGRKARQRGGMSGASLRLEGGTDGGARGGQSLMAEQDASGVGGRLTTAETVVWPLVHDSFLRHALAWCWELRRAATYDLAREPWRALEQADRAGNMQMAPVDIRPYKDSPYWFCAANRQSWDYEYGWFSGRAFAPRQRLEPRAPTLRSGSDLVPTFRLEDGFWYYEPVVSPLSVHVETRLPVKHAWGCKLGDVEAVPPVLSEQQERAANEGVLRSLQHMHGFLPLEGEPHHN